MDINRRVVITGISVLCAEAQSLSELSQVGRDFAAIAEPWFVPETYLGPRGFKYLTPATRYALAATKVAIGDSNRKGQELESFYEPSERGVYLGSNFATHQVLAELDETVLQHSSDAISPMLAPSFSLNVASSYISIQRQYCAFNISLTSPMVAGLEAVMFAADSIRRGRANMVIAGATEDRPAAECAAALGIPEVNDGAIVFILEERESAQQRGANIYAEVGHHLQRFANPQSADSLTTLSKDFDAYFSMMSSGNDRNVACLKSNDVFNARVRELVNSSLYQAGIKNTDEPFIGQNGKYVSLSPLLGLATLLVDKPGMVCATSPLGHIAFLNTFREGVHHDR